MTIAVTDKADPARVQEIRDANDRFRRNLSSGTVLLSSGVVALGGKAQSRILEAVRAFDDFDADDPADTHDLGDFVIEVSGLDATARSELIFFRIDQTNPTGDEPRLTIFLASEWWSPPIDSITSICLENKS
jgi:hypothetical protein